MTASGREHQPVQQAGSPSTRVRLAPSISLGRELSRSPDDQSHVGPVARPTTNHM